MRRLGTGHWTVPVGRSAKHETDDLKRRVFHVAKNKSFQYRELKKIHRIFAHPAPEKMELLLRDAANNEKGILKKIKKVYE